MYILYNTHIPNFELNYSNIGFKKNYIFEYNVIFFNITLVTIII